MPVVIYFLLLIMKLNQSKAAKYAELIISFINSLEEGALLLP